MKRHSFQLRCQRLIKGMARLHLLWLWAVQISIFAISGVAAFLLRFDITVPSEYLNHLKYSVMIWVCVKTLVFRLQRLNRGWWRFVSVYDVLHILLGNLIGSVCSALIILLVFPNGFPRSLYFLDFLICFLATTGIRISVRLVFDLVRANRQPDPGKRIVIYGAGESGVILLREIRSNPNLLYTVCGFVDDNPKKRGVKIQGVPVLGDGSSLSMLVERFRLDETLIATPSATGPEMTEILRRCYNAAIRCRTIPAMAEIIEGRALTKQIRDVAVEDLLGRKPVRLEEDLIRTKIANRVVMVTGAAGSIGSELCRQVAKFQPSLIVAYETAETALFHLNREMRTSFPDVDFAPEMGNIQNRQRLSETIERYAPSIIYHAAAYKHVPMMESNVIEAVENNVFGTYEVARAAADYGVADFVMISSDKAVRPTNMMGATKRVAELTIKALQNERTKFVSVRFGNVLGSNGSVIPLFKQQIASGGPVCVTHPEMRRYFMTIPEAVQLVLQASTMGKGGEIFVLDMGDPVNILDLANNLILLSGLRPNEDIKIEFSGIRPGEKLYEELITDGEEIAPTYHDKIRVFTGKGIAAGKMLEYLDILRKVCSARDLRRLLFHLKEIVPEYKPSNHVLRQLQPEHASAVGEAERAGSARWTHAGG